jgi:hypothetical protein
VDSLTALTGTRHRVSGVSQARQCGANRDNRKYRSPVGMGRRALFCRI